MKQREKENLGQIQPKKRDDYVKPTITPLEKPKNVTAGPASPPP